LDKIKTIDEIKDLCFRAVSLGDAEAQYLLGRHFDIGDSEYVAKDYVKAVEWYTKAAEQGHAIAQFNLGICYYNGEGVAKDYVKAAEWYTKAAEQGHAEAQNNLGYCYYNGEGIDKDYVKAAEWYTKAAEQGHAEAQNNLGYCYYWGRSVGKDYVKAVEWFTKAAEQGDEDAKEKLKLIETKIAAMDRTKVFISYSHKDKKYFDELVEYFEALKLNGIEIWHDKMIQPGNKWREEIREYMSKTKVAVLMMSHAFLTSDFVRNTELPELLRAAEEEQATIMWLPVGVYNKSITVITGENGDKIDITEYQAVCDPNKPLKNISDEHEREIIYNKLCDEIIRCFNK